MSGPTPSPPAPAHGLAPIPLDSVAIAHHVRVTYGIPCDPATIRKWAQRGKIRRLLGSSPRLNRFDLREVIAYMRSIGWLT